MTTQKKSWLSQNWRALLFVIFELLALIGVFYFWISSESDRYSVSTQKIFPWVAGACGVAFIAGIYIFNAARKKW